MQRGEREQSLVVDDRKIRTGRIGRVLSDNLISSATIIMSPIRCDVAAGQRGVVFPTWRSGTVRPVSDAQVRKLMESSGS